MQVVQHGNVFIPVAKPKSGAQGTPAQSQPAIGANGSFSDILSRKITESDKLQFSKHAEMRLKSRDITLSSEQMERAVQGVEKAKTKGIRDSLVLIDNVALVVNTKSNVVITALEHGADNVFTNIDGAVIV